MQKKDSGILLKTPSVPFAEQDLSKNPVVAAPEQAMDLISNLLELSTEWRDTIAGRHADDQLTTASRKVNDLKAPLS